MNQVLIKKGRAVLSEIPVPSLSDDGILVKVIYSCISAGTEMMGISESGKSLIKKAMEQPEKVKKALNMIKRQGIDSVFEKLRYMESGKTTGYSASGIVIGVGKNIRDIKIGDRVACFGAGYANHAEYIDVPRNLAVKVPNGLNLQSASTVALGGIAMQCLRRADLRLGEIAAVIGLGILGQITVQMLKAAGCRVIGIDIDDRRLEVAMKTNCDFVLNSSKVDVLEEVHRITQGYGVDSAIITAASNSNLILSEAFNICRKKGRTVLVGVVGNQFNREEMYQKELDFCVATSYGPGRYDENYEAKGIDYPYAYVRWTENRNMEEYLRLLEEKKIEIDILIEKVYDIEDAAKAYEELNNHENKPLIVLLKYSEVEKKSEKKVYIHSNLLKKEGKINVAVIGAGDFAKKVHLPNLKKLNEIFNIYAIASKTGTNSKFIAEQFGAQYATTDFNEILNDKDIDMVMICTRHNSHAKIAIDSMKAGKAVFVEKPAALNEKELDEVLKAIKETNMPFTVGFNRRFSKYALEAKRCIQNRINPMIINYQMNAGYIPIDSWVHNEEGGGRIIGEGCHIFDLFNYFTDSEAECISVNSITAKTKNISHRDNFVATVKYKDGSVCTLTYTSLGNSKYPKEFCQIYFDGKMITIEEYKKINGYGIKLKNFESIIEEKGHYEELIEFGRAMKNGNKYPIPLWQFEQAAKLSFAVDNAIAEN